jgi:hypothetical protein
MENDYLEVNGNGRMKSVRYTLSSFVFADERETKTRQEVQVIITVITSVKIAMVH